MRKRSEKVPKQMRATFEAIVALTNGFSQHHLNGEYAELARQATADLCRKRPSPLLQGRMNSWACGVVHALGTVNFLFDKSLKPHMTTGELSEAFSVAASTSAAKSKAVRDTLGMVPMDPRWTLPSQLGNNPMAWMIVVDGLVVDARSIPREVQELAYEKGLIPYVPGRKERPQ